MQEKPLVSCLCLSYRRPGFLTNAIECFQSQTYPNRELVVVGHAGDEATCQVVRNAAAANIKFVAAPALSMGLLRNLAIEESAGEYFCQWDDDDWHHNSRLEIQLAQMRANGKQASVVAYHLMYDRLNEAAYLSFPFMWPPTLLCSRSIYNSGIQYEDMQKDEGVNFLMKLYMFNYLYPVVAPYLYTYIYHGDNSRQFRHFTGLFSQSQRLSAQASMIVKQAVGGTYNKEYASALLADTALADEFNYFGYAGNTYTGQEDERGEEFFRLLSAKTVLNGPFKGLKYPDLESAGSAIIPKLTGSYEHELSEIICGIIGNDYTDILDIGCAEGYYANGLALKCPRAAVYAYDIDERARDICRKMAVLNGVSNRVHVRSACTAATIENFRFSGRGLIICDCEGFEYELFNEDNIQHLRDCDLLIETHDFVNINISTRLAALFGHTHEVVVVKSTDDFQKAKSYSFPPFQHLTDLADKKYIYAEHRPCIMEWLWLKSKRYEKL
ncbi:glycosyltransferase [Chitinophaga japonensis]|uniref:Methyltransferase family protein n=1 Tax=Chitinophaga japonensis TaxID=104662 RepID=A0A562SMM2_CHIJA|nr:glycosyltransferase [Chitinophaga japonensis]TWI81950.1 methyltransferase family protein [Chitinophaga japonensis]